MNKCIKCGSYAFNLYKEGIDQGGLCDVHYWQGRSHRAEALAQPEQEPVANASAWFALVMNAAAEIEDASNCLRDEDAKRVAVGGAKYYRDAANTLYTTPQRTAAEGEDTKTWVGLTNDEVYESYLVDTNMSKEKDWVLMFYEAIEAKLKAKNERKEKNT